MSKSKIECEYSSLTHDTWKSLPEAFGTAGARWKLLHVSPDAGSWTAEANKGINGVRLDYNGNEGDKD